MLDYLYDIAIDKRRGIVAVLISLPLFLLSIIYGLIVRGLILWQRAHAFKLNVKVISIGNITLGGTGKTTLVEFTCRYLRQKGHKVAIISRGYKRKKTKHQSMGDEPYMLAEKLGDIPVIVDADRIRGAKRAMRDYGVDTVVLDDGFQQWGLKKDLEIVTIDAGCPFGNRNMIPRGILREPLSSLKRTDVFVLAKTNLSPDIEALKESLRKINPQGMIFESMHVPLSFYDINDPGKFFDPSFLKGKTVALFSGIGDPDSFEKLISSLGVGIGLALRFKDHYNYNAQDLDNIIACTQDKSLDIIVTTEKDAARLTCFKPQAQGVKFLVLRIGIQIKDEQGFHNRLLNLYSL